MRRGTPPQVSGTEATNWQRGRTKRIWQREEVRSALELATPVLSAAVEAVVQGKQRDPRHVRRTALSAVCAS
ncbi:hypothetical protein [Streptomyces sp. LN500]|uniref:hypothetical protein n=1 Tax=Streptomyces sp. LN500 TaxID=3112978 RepID=UPI003710DAD3